MKGRFLPFLLLQLPVVFVFAQNVQPLESGGKYYFEFNQVYFEVNPNAGARISSFQLDGQEVLYTNQGSNWGSTFWPAPQSAWGWPPPSAIDNQYYQVSLTDSSIVAKGNEDYQTKLKVKKVFSASRADTSVTVTYGLYNTKSTTASWAPWEITRLPAEGLSFFEPGSGQVTGNMAGNTTLSNAHIWYNQNTTSTSASVNKFFCDGTGWLAHVNPHNQLFVKVFEDISAGSFAPSEAEIEVYTDPNHTYTELENQGAYVTLAAGDSLLWTVKWYVRNLPETIQVTVGDPSLIDYVNQLVQGSIVGISKRSEQSRWLRFDPVGKTLHTTEPVALVVFDMTGGMVYRKSDATLHHLQHLSAGVYFIRACQGQQVYTHKIVLR